MAGIRRGSVSWFEFETTRIWNLIIKGDDRTLPEETRNIFKTEARKVTRELGKYALEHPDEKRKWIEYLEAKKES